MVTCQIFIWISFWSTWGLVSMSSLIYQLSGFFSLFFLSSLRPFYSLFQKDISSCNQRRSLRLVWISFFYFFSNQLYPFRWVIYSMIFFLALIPLHPWTYILLSILFFFDRYPPTHWIPPNFFSFATWILSSKTIDNSKRKNSLYLSYLDEMVLWVYDRGTWVGVLNWSFKLETSIKLEHFLVSDWKLLGK